MFCATSVRAPMGKFITFEGIEGSGKTTQLKMAGEYLKKNDIPFILTEEPGGTAMGKRIREIVLNISPFHMCAEAELLLFLAARAQHVREVIIPALLAKKLVLCDRFSDATLAYQGFGRKLNIDQIETLNDFSADRLKPNLTILFDLAPDVGLKRAAGRIANLGEGTAREDRFEREDVQFHETIREGYLILAKREPERFRIIDGSENPAAVHRKVCSLLLPFLEV
jgi:dTMP kinase